VCANRRGVDCLFLGAAYKTAAALTGGRSSLRGTSTAEPLRAAQQQQSMRRVGASLGEKEEGECHNSRQERQGIVHANSLLSDASMIPDDGEHAEQPVRRARP
jgi:hypothetical protein